MLLRSHQLSDETKSLHEEKQELPLFITHDIAEALKQAHSKISVLDMGAGPQQYGTPEKTNTASYLPVGQ